MGFSQSLFAQDFDDVDVEQTPNELASSVSEIELCQAFTTAYARQASSEQDVLKKLQTVIASDTSFNLALELGRARAEGAGRQWDGFPHVLTYERLVERYENEGHLTESMRLNPGQAVSSCRELVQPDTLERAKVRNPAKESDPEKRKWKISAALELTVNPDGSMITKGLSDLEWAEFCSLLGHLYVDYERFSSIMELRDGNARADIAAKINWASETYLNLTTGNQDFVRSFIGPQVSDFGRQLSGVPDRLQMFRTCAAIGERHYNLLESGTPFEGGEFYSDYVQQNEQHLIFLTSDQPSVEEVKFTNLWLLTASHEDGL